MLAVAICLLPLTGRSAGVNPPGFPPFASDEYQPARLSPKEPEVVIDYPGGAITRGIAQGTAVVSVLVDAEGNPIDFVVISCTDLSFGTKLLDQAKVLKYQAAKLKGVAVPARYDLGYEFKNFSTAVNPMDAARQKMEKTAGTKLAYKPVAEKELDHPLEITSAALPQLPEGMTATDNNPVKVFVTFYVDEYGHVRSPNVESAASPQLIPGAISAISQWSFKPPQVKGKPALVFVGRAIRFVPRQAASVRARGLAKND
jgi:outer membrane biosynthesis protein TonB